MPQLQGRDPGIQIEKVKTWYAAKSCRSNDNVAIEWIGGQRPNSVADIHGSDKVRQRAAHVVLVVDDVFVVIVGISHIDVVATAAVNAVVVEWHERPDFDGLISGPADDDGSTSRHVDRRNFTAVTITLGECKISRLGIPSEK